MLGEQALWEVNNVEAGLSLTPWGLIPGKPLWTNTISGDVAALQDAIDLLNDTVNNLQQNAVPYTNALWNVDLGSRSLNAGALRVVGVDVATLGANTFTGNQTVNGNLNIANLSSLSVDGGLSPTLQNVGGFLSIGNLFGGNGIRFRANDGTEWARFVGPTSGRLLLGSITDDLGNRLQVGGGIYSSSNISAAGNITTPSGTVSAAVVNVGGVSGATRLDAVVDSNTPRIAGFTSGTYRWDVGGGLSSCYLAHATGPVFLRGSEVQARNNGNTDFSNFSAANITTSGTITAGGNVFLPNLFSIGGASTPGTLRNGIRHLGSDALDIVVFGNTRARFRWANTLQLPSTSGIDWMSSTDFPNATIVASLIPSSAGIHLGRQGLAYNLFVQADQANGRVGLPQNSVIGWASNADPGNALTAGLSQIGANTVALGNGTAGNASGTLSLGQIQLNGSNSFLNFQGGSEHYLGGITYFRMPAFPFANGVVINGSTGNVTASGIITSDNAAGGLHIINSAMRLVKNGASLLLENQSTGWPVDISTNGTVNIVNPWGGLPSIGFSTTRNNATPTTRLVEPSAATLAIRNSAGTLSGTLEARTITTTAADHGAGQGTLVLAPFNGNVTMANSVLSFGSGLGGFVCAQNVGYQFSQWTNNSANGHEFGLYRTGTNTASLATTQAATTLCNLNLGNLTTSGTITSNQAGFSNSLVWGAGGAYYMRADGLVSYPFWHSAGSNTVCTNGTFRVRNQTDTVDANATCASLTSSGLVSAVTGLEVRGAHHYRFDTNGNDGRIRNITSGAVPLYFDSSGNVTVGSNLTATNATLNPPATVTPSVTNGSLTFEATSNTSLTIKYRGSDGVVRSTVLPLS
jgi:hypothetical protein